ncbi:hypothetical protein GSI_10405 [Ganoderma sinense ZZ0214-1]|uniref:RNA polymerase II subunit A C-terminal domain phosphatase n=1 Tax=Ganoderma sinense ZZ0214-1 TaxID=1077348 RepID=A0A2G8S0G1_9APHY|nr:hypothetical protein GSI_10405 [Ganoderma sinense ZZ0214-1]
MSSPTQLKLPNSLPYPIKLLHLAAPPNTDVQRGTRLLDYSFAYLSPEGQTESRFGTWDSPLDGTITRWLFNKGEVIHRSRAEDSPAVSILEPCKHGIVFGGLCGICGKDLTRSDYLGSQMDHGGATIPMTHDRNGPTVSLEEAQRIERDTAQHLYSSRKLSLIVDLDQTIVHATVDPTVGEWIGEGEAWEARQAKKVAALEEKENEKEEGEKEEQGALGDPGEDEDEVNPNWEALKDVKKFRLGPEALGQPHQRGLKGKSKEKTIEQNGCMYYIKPRPGLLDFLETMATKYEMHVYTMGTRAYAEEVCAAIDPGGKVFGNRILSRDESGSLTQKSLHRLFPCDQSMVVIIDDRADVWEWSPNLVKVVPSSRIEDDFFVGIGDINSAFLPKLEPLAPVVPPPPPPTTAAAVDGADPALAVPEAEDEDDEDVDEDVVESSDALSSPAEEGLSEAEKNEMLSQNTLALEAQVEERPLAKKQEELQETAKEEAAEKAEHEASESASEGNGTVPTLPEQHEKREKPVQKALLKNDDNELDRVQQILELVHERFYVAYDVRKPDGEHRSPKKRSAKKHDAPVEYDVRTIIPRIRMDTLAGVHILFTGVIPLDQRPHTAEIWKTATAFGAQCHTELSNKVTHVVTNKDSTQKVDAARRCSGIHIVWLNWLTDSLALWRRQDETPYLLHPTFREDTGTPAAVASPASDAHQISSDPDPDANDWDELHVDSSAGGSGGSRAIGVLGVEGPGPGLDMDGEFTPQEVDWDAANNEVDEFLNEPDDEEEGGGEAGNVNTMGGGGMSEDEGSLTDESNSIISSTTSSPRTKRKRVRSLTPSEIGVRNGADADVLRSPLAKRKKLTADRSGASPLKEAFTAEQLHGTSRRTSEDLSGSRRSSPMNGVDDDDENTEDDDDGSEVNMIDDDFLARELEEEWG